MQLADIKIDPSKDNLHDACGMTSEEWKAFEEKVNAFLNGFIEKADASRNPTMPDASTLSKADLLKDMTEHFTMKEIVILAGFEVIGTMEYKIQMQLQLEQMQSMIQPTGPGGEA